MTTKSIIAQEARNEILKERNEKAKEALKALYRDELAAKDVLKSIQRKIQLEEKKLEE